MALSMIEFKYEALYAPLAEGEIFYHTPSNTSIANGKVTESLMANEKVSRKGAKRERREEELLW
jgi:hypothetical protein